MFNRRLFKTKKTDRYLIEAFAASYDIVKHLNDINKNFDYKLSIRQLINLIVNIEISIFLTVKDRNRRDALMLAVGFIGYVKEHNSDVLQLSIGTLDSFYDYCKRRLSSLRRGSCNIYFERMGITVYSDVPYEDRVYFPTVKIDDVNDDELYITKFALNDLRTVHVHVHNELWTTERVTIHENDIGDTLGFDSYFETNVVTESDKNPLWYDESYDNYHKSALKDMEGEYYVPHLYGMKIIYDKYGRPKASKYLI